MDVQKKKGQQEGMRKKKERGSLSDMGHCRLGSLGVKYTETGPIS